MKLTSERLEVEQGERIRAVLIVHASRVSVIAAGGLDHLRHELEDVGLRVRALFTKVPRAAGWEQAGEVPAPSDLEWLVYAELEATRTASLRRELTEDLRIARAWLGETATFDVVPHPYAVDAEHGTGLLAGRMLVFCVAYPTREGPT